MNREKNGSLVKNLILKRTSCKQYFTDCIYNKLNLILYKNNSFKITCKAKRIPYFKLISLILNKNTKSEEKNILNYINRQRNCSYLHIIISCLFFIFFSNRLDFCHLLIHI